MDSFPGANIDFCCPGVGAAAFIFPKQTAEHNSCWESHPGSQPGPPPAEPHLSRGRLAARWGALPPRPRAAGSFLSSGAGQGVPHSLLSPPGRAGPALERELLDLALPSPRRTRHSGRECHLPETRASQRTPWPPSRVFHLASQASPARGGSRSDPAPAPGRGPGSWPVLECWPRWEPPGARLQFFTLGLQTSAKTARP